MRRLIAFLTILVSSFGFISTALPATASAASCTTTSSAIQRTTDQGYQIMRYSETFSACTGVDTVEFHYVGTGFQDYTDGLFHQAYLEGNTLDIQVNVTEGGGATAGIPPGIGQTCWYGSGVMHSLRTWFEYRIHNASTHTWGPLHGYLGSNVGGGPFGITC